MVCVPAVGDKWTARARVYGILSRLRGQHIPGSHFGQMTRSVVSSPAHPPDTSPGSPGMKDRGCTTKF